MKQVARSVAVLLLSFMGVTGDGIAQSTTESHAWSSLVSGTAGLENFEQLGTADWTAADGAVQATRGTGEPAYLVSKSTYRNFVIRAEFWASDDADSGIMLRCENRRQIGSVTCYQVNIFDQSPDPGFGTGSIVYIARVQPMPKVAGKWSALEITADGARLVVVVNGQKTVDTTESRLVEGPIALQWASGTIRFRKVLIRAL